MPNTISVPQLCSVTGAIDPAAAGTVDGHTHVWIDDAGGIDPASPVLTAAEAISRGLEAYHAAGGATLIDCQPGGCGRNGGKLRQLSRASGVSIVAATGFHLRRYYPADAPFFAASTAAAQQHFVKEITVSLDETSRDEQPVRAGFIKIACEDSLERTPRQLVEAAVLAACDTDAAIEVHTERGADAERIARFMLDAGLPPGKLILCHIDKRPDFALHAELAQAGIALEYDTFFRPKYHPEDHLWPLLGRMIEAGYADAIVAATDMADVAMWQQEESGKGPAGFLTRVIPGMKARGYSSDTIRKLTGLNVAARLARVVRESQA